MNPYNHVQMNGSAPNTTTTSLSSFDIDEGNGGGNSQFFVDDMISNTATSEVKNPLFDDDLYPFLNNNPPTVVANPYYAQPQQQQPSSHVMMPSLNANYNPHAYSYAMLRNPLNLDPQSAPRLVPFPATITTNNGNNLNNQQLNTSQTLNISKQQQQASQQPQQLRNSGSFTSTTTTTHAEVLPSVIETQLVPLLNDKGGISVVDRISPFLKILQDEKITTKDKQLLLAVMKPTITTRACLKTFVESGGLGILGEWITDAVKGKKDKVLQLLFDTIEGMVSVTTMDAVKKAGLGKMVGQISKAHPNEEIVEKAEKLKKAWMSAFKSTGTSLSGSGGIESVGSPTNPSVTTTSPTNTPQTTTTNEEEDAASKKRKAASSLTQEVKKPKSKIKGTEAVPSTKSTKSTLKQTPAVESLPRESASRGNAGSSPTNTNTTTNTPNTSPTSTPSESRTTPKAPPQSTGGKSFLSALDRASSDRASTLAALKLQKGKSNLLGASLNAALAPKKVEHRAMSADDIRKAKFKEKVLKTLPLPTSTTSTTTTTSTINTTTTTSTTTTTTTPSNTNMTNATTNPVDLQMSPNVSSNDDEEEIEELDTTIPEENVKVEAVQSNTPITQTIATRSSAFTVSSKDNKESLGGDDSPSDFGGLMDDYTKRMPVPDFPRDDKGEVIKVEDTGRLKPSKKRGTRIKWASDDKLLKIKEFTVEPLESGETGESSGSTTVHGSFEDMRQREKAMERGKHQNKREGEEKDWIARVEELEATTNWHRIPPILLGEDIVLAKGDNSAEVSVQIEREKHELMTIYRSLSKIPESPHSPPPSSVSEYNDEDVLIIPWNDPINPEISGLDQRHPENMNQINQQMDNNNNFNDNMNMNLNMNLNSSNPMDTNLPNIDYTQLLALLPNINIHQVLATLAAGGGDMMNNNQTGMGIMGSLGNIGNNNNMGNVGNNMDVTAMLNMLNANVNMANLGNVNMNDMNFARQFSGNNSGNNAGDFLRGSGNSGNSGGRRACNFYGNRGCRNGDDCPFIHIGPPGPNDVPPSRIIQGSNSSTRSSW